VYSSNFPSTLPAFRWLAARPPRAWNITPSRNRHPSVPITMILTNAERLQILSVAPILHGVLFAPILPRRPVVRPERHKSDSETRPRIPQTFGWFRCDSETFGSFLPGKGRRSALAQSFPPRQAGANGLIEMVVANLQHQPRVEFTGRLWDSSPPGVMLGQ
jgi:hypothetical protein